VDQISGTTTSDATAQLPQQEPPAGASPAAEPTGFRSRGSARRRARFLRKARELGYRDLGGLVFNLHRFGQRNDALVLAKLTTLSHIDTELRALEGMLGERRPVTVLREAGVTACPRCAAIHSSEDNFCPNCGFSISHQADLPIAVPAATTTPTPVATTSPAAAPAGAQTTKAPAVQEPPSAPVSPSSPLPSASAAATGRSPSPPSTPAKAPAASSSMSSSPPTPSDEDGPTEIISPPLPGS
jgi:hypothetical protein